MKKRVFWILNSQSRGVRLCSLFVNWCLHLRGKLLHSVTFDFINFYYRFIHRENNVAELVQTRTRGEETRGEETEREDSGPEVRMSHTDIQRVDMCRGVVGWSCSAAASVSAQWTVPTLLLSQHPIRNESSSRKFRNSYFFCRTFPSPLAFPSSSPVSIPSIAAPIPPPPPICSSVIFFSFLRYYFTLSTVSAGPLCSWEDWTIYFCEDTSVSNHSISRRVDPARTHAPLLLIETLLPVNGARVRFERNTVCARCACVFLIYCFSSKMFPIPSCRAGIW